MLNESTDAEAAARFARELADLRVLYDNCQIARDHIALELDKRDKEIEGLHRLMATIHTLSDGNEAVRVICEDVLIGKLPE